MKDTKKGKPSENNDFDNKEPGGERSSLVLKAFIIKCPTATDQDGPRNIRFAQTTPTGGGGGGPPGGPSRGSPGGPPSGPPPGEPPDGPPGGPPGWPPGGPPGGGNGVDPDIVDDNRIEAEHSFEFPRMAAVYVVPLVTGPGDEPQEVVPNPPVHHYLELQGFNRNIQVAVAAEEPAVWPLAIAPAFAHNLRPNTAPADRTPRPNDPNRSDTVALLHAAAAQHAARETVDIARTPQDLRSAEERGPDDRTRLTAAAGQYSLHEGSGSLPLPQFGPRPASLAEPSGAALAHEQRPPLNPLDNAVQLATPLPDPGAEHQHNIAASGHHQDASVTTSPSTPATQVPDNVLGNCWLCITRPPDVALLPCGHLVVCNACAPRVVLCPKCISFVDKHIQVYIP